MTMIERMEAIEKRLRVVEEQLQQGPVRHSLGCYTPSCMRVPPPGTLLCTDCAGLPPEERERRARARWGPGGIAYQPPQPAVPDELVRQLEACVEEVLGTAVGTEWGASVNVSRHARNRLAVALDSVRTAREKGAQG